MAVRFDTFADRLAYGAAAPPATFTVTCWAYLSVDRATWSTFVQLRTAADATVAELASSGTSGPYYWDDSSGLSGSTGWVVGEWRKVAMTRSGSSGKLLSAATGSTEVISGTVTTGTPDRLTLGARGPNDSGQWWDGRLAHVRIWDSVLSQGEIEAEWASATPVKTSGIWANWPLATATDLTDTVSSRVLTTGATAVTTEDSPDLGGASTSASAGNAAGTGLARQPTVTAGSSAGSAAGIGAARQPTVSTTTSANAGSAGGTGTARQPAISTTTSALAGVAAGIGAALTTQPDIDYPIRAGTILNLAALDHAGTIRDLSAHYRAGTVLDMTGSDAGTLSILGNSGAALAIPIASRAALLTLTDDCVFTFTGTLDSAYIHVIDLVITQDYLGNHRITWPTTTRWPGGRPPELSTFPGSIDKVTLTTYDGGTTWLGELARTGYNRAGHPLVGWSMPAEPKTIPGVANEILGRWQARSTWLEVAGALYLDGTELVPYSAAHPGRAADLGIALIPHDVVNTQWNTELDAVIAGTHDADHYAQGQALAALGPATVYARPWWEFNSENPATHIDKTKFIGAWQRGITNVRRGFAHDARPGQRLYINYSPLPDRADQYTDFYPGDEYVDVISYDVYGKVWSATNPSVPTMIAQVTAWLTDLAAFGRSRGKPVAVSEWANLATKGDPGTFDNRGCGDCVEYIDLMFDWAEDPANNVLYLCYYDSSEAGVDIDLDDTPLSKARFTARAQAIQTTPAYPAPDTPTIGTATAGAGSASVAFTPDASGHAATGYTATSTPGSHTGTGSSSPVTVTGLTPATAYTFTVHATNEGGDSAESAASNSATPYTTAVGFDQTYDRLLYSAVAPPATFTITMWAYLAVDRDAWSTLVQLRTSGDATVAELAADSSGTGGPMYWDGSASLTGTTGFTTGAWRKLAITRTGSTGKLYSATPAGSTQVITGTVGTGTPASLTLAAQGPNDSTAFWNGRIACVRVWSSVLTQGEIEAEWPSITPVKTSGLWANWRLAGISDLTDTVAGRVLTTRPGYGLTLEQGPPVT